MRASERQIAALVQIATGWVRELGDIDPQRRAVLDEAITWIGTPFHDKGTVKGAGVDCLYLIYECYRATGVVGEIQIPYYRPDFMHHRDEQTYWGGLMQHGHEVEHPGPGDVALFKYGRVLGHGVLVVSWPHCLIHAFAEGGMVTLGDATQGTLAIHRPVRFASAFSQ